MPQLPPFRTRRQAPYIAEPTDTPPDVESDAHFMLPEADADTLPEDGARFVFRDDHPDVAGAGDTRFVVSEADDAGADALPSEPALAVKPGGKPDDDTPPTPWPFPAQPTPGRPTPAPRPPRSAADDDDAVPVLTQVVEPVPAAAVGDELLSSADDAMAERIAAAVAATLEPIVRDTVLDAVRDALAARRSGHD